MVAADALAILVGAIAGKHLPERLIQLTAAALFVVFGVSMLVEGFFRTTPYVVGIAIGFGVVLIAGAALRALPERLRPPVMRATFVPPAEEALTPCTGGQSADRNDSR
jgi:Ca2+/H+ antiporter, TMEM165/GDT1 family